LAMNDKLPTEWDLLNKIWHIINQQVEEEILLSSEVQYEIEKHIESHTQAHTKELREELKETQNIADASTYQLKRLVGKYNKLREKAKELEALLNHVDYE